MKKIYLIRHGNAYDANWHQEPTSDLNPNGIQHAIALANRFKDFKVDAVFCSTMERAKDTCDEFLKFHSYIKPIYVDSLREVIDEKFASDHEKLVFLKDQFDEMKTQIFTSLNEIVNSSVGDNIFLFTHGHWIRFAMLSVLGGNLAGFFNMDVSFASVTVLEVEDREMKLLTFNDCTHTSDLPYGCYAFGNKI